MDLQLHNRSCVAVAVRLPGTGSRHTSLCAKSMVRNSFSPLCKIRVLQRQRRKVDVMLVNIFRCWHHSWLRRNSGLKLNVPVGCYGEEEKRPITDEAAWTSVAVRPLEILILW